MTEPKSRNPYSTDWTAPAAGGFLITPDNDADLARVTRGLSFGTAGALAVIMEDGSDFIIPNGALAAGVIHPIRVRRVKDTGTDADGIVGWGES